MPHEHRDVQIELLGHEIVEAGGIPAIRGSPDHVARVLIGDDVLPSRIGQEARQPTHRQSIPPPDVDAPEEGDGGGGSQLCGYSTVQVAPERSSLAKSPGPRRSITESIWAVIDSPYSGRSTSRNTPIGVGS